MGEIAFDELETYYYKVKHDYEYRSQLYQEGKIPAETWIIELDLFKAFFTYVNFIMGEKLKDLQGNKNETKIIL